jgi:hypothetical protein
MNKNYQKGRRYEYKLKKLLEGIGYRVLRTAGSHGTFKTYKPTEKDRDKIRKEILPTLARKNGERVVKKEIWWWDGKNNHIEEFI